MLYIESDGQTKPVSRFMPSKYNKLKFQYLKDIYYIYISSRHT